MSVSVCIQRLYHNLAGDRDDPRSLFNDLVFALIVLLRDSSSRRSSSSGACMSLTFMNFAE